MSRFDRLGEAPQNDGLHQPRRAGQRGKMLRTNVEIIGMMLFLSGGGALYGADPVNLTKKEAGQEFRLSIKQEVVVVLESNATTGYSWSVRCEPKDAFEALGKPEYTPDKPILVGSGGRQRYRFRAAQVGTAKLTFENRRSWERDVPPIETITYAFTVR
jgi:predicted secreted protein